MLNAIFAGFLSLLASLDHTDAARHRMTASYIRAMSHFDAGRWAQAATELRAAYARLPAPALLYAEAACHERLGASERAAKLYARYLAEAGNPHDAIEVRQRVTALRLGMKPPPAEPKGILLVRSNPAGARIYLGDRSTAPLGTTPWSGQLDGVQTLIITGEGISDRYEVARPRPRAVTVIDVR